ncbi:amino acid/amide ABC transporter ATP-binding protein 2, HAAT family [Rhizobium tibeticum]|uniref:Amino acid/amide ABC transporter ATP-binding protein 2, HAAT family n=1 Tax=Rhizobium tibeticum TaxID=501024 RepID=A0A1H8KTK3_9HYPH|nr:ABC transporter ATP-binding protein [Rhizobium tibeticum]SEH83743.1 LIV-I protein F [Rhizobium tibeticum]SEN95946.1 amino acid/amide ABC transporter ATP-binding protein 2, HAAT family [Rhizobium tibeticum]
MTTEPPILSTHGLCAGYGDFQALFSVDFEIMPGEVVALIGANGAGKSTLLKAVMGLLPSNREMIRHAGVPVGGSAPYQMVQNGFAMVPEGRRLFAGMTVEDNLLVAVDHGRKNGAAIWTMQRVFDLFPALASMRKRLVEKMSGGQQQMVAIGRALLSQPKVLLCDEISLGLAPKVIGEIYDSMPAITKAGTAVILVEQDVSRALAASNRLYCILEGRITLSGNSADVAREDIARAYFGADHAVA